MSVPQPPFLSYISPQYFSFPDTLDFPHLLCLPLLKCKLHEDRNPVYVIHCCHFQHLEESWHILSAQLIFVKQ